MKTIDEVYQESLETINKAAVINTIAKEIQNVTDALTKAELKNWSADQISRAITTLAILRVNLGQKWPTPGPTTTSLPSPEDKVRFGMEAY
jgi:hypothetical protein